MYIMQVLTLVAGAGQTVQIAGVAYGEATLIAYPVRVEDCCFTGITQFSHSLHSFPPVYWF